MSLKKRKDSKFWWARFKVRGKEYFFSTGETDSREAKKQERKERDRITAEQIEKAHNDEGERVAHGCTVADVGALDLKRAAAERLHPDTIAMYVTHWSNLQGFFGDTLMSSVTPQKLVDYVRHRQQAPERKIGNTVVHGPGRGNKTIRKELTSFKRGLQMARAEKLDAAMPDQWPRLKSGEKHEGRRGKLRAPELLRSWFNMLPQAAREEAVFAALTGVRWAELKRIELGWIVETGGGCGMLKLPAWATKARRKRDVALTPLAMSIVAGARDAGRTTTLFEAKDRSSAYFRASRKLNLEHPITLRDLRHTFGSTSHEVGQDLTATMEAMGHSDLKSAQDYQSSTTARTVAATAMMETALGLTIDELRRKKAEQVGGAGDRRRKAQNQKTV